MIERHEQTSRQRPYGNPTEMEQLKCGKMTLFLHDNEKPRTKTVDMADCMPKGRGVAVYSSLTHDERKIGWGFETVRRENVDYCDLTT